MSSDRLIENTDVPARHPWPADVYVQGGASGVVFTRRGWYRTAFVEAFPDGTFIRGEGETVEAAEDACWARYENMKSCPAAHMGHGPFDPGDFSNGAGFCTLCGAWFPNVL